MARVVVVVEGPTEESFINNVLSPFLALHGVYLTPYIIGVPGHKGGNVNYARVRKDILLLLKQDHAAYCSTMLDLYGLRPGFPGMPTNLVGVAKAAHLEAAMHQDIVTAIPDLRPDIRFIAYLQVHEYEGLLFSDTVAFASALRRQGLGGPLAQIRAAFETPEHINDDPNQAPSKRILGLYPSYQKVIEGTVAAQAVGLDIMQKQCLHFREWVERLSAVP